MQDDDATPTDTAPEEEDETVSADGDNAEQDRADTKYREASAYVTVATGEKKVLEAAPRRRSPAPRPTLRPSRLAGHGQ